MSRVLVTGAAGHLGTALLPRLLADPDIARIIAFDRAPPATRHEKLEIVVGDIMGSRLALALEGVDAVVHLAFIVLAQSLGGRRQDRALMRRVNVEGTRRVVALARQAGARRLIYASSVAVYGAWPDNPPLIDEDQPRRPMPGFAYGEDKAAVEDWLDCFEAEGSGLAVTRLRLHAIVGPNALPLVNRLARSRLYLRLAEPQPRVQCLWEEDAASAIIAALKGPAGIYNIAAPKPVRYRDLVGADGRFGLGVPFASAERLHRLISRWTGAWGELGWLAGFRYPLAVSAERAAAALGWKARFSVSDCVRALRQRPHAQTVWLAR
jgi:UDP-glucose 4-epimerase